MTAIPYSASEMMTVAAARALSNDDICFVGIGLPSAACNLARLTHAPRLTLVYESGTLETKPTVLPLSIGDGELCETALTTVSVPEMFRYWLQGGRISVGFLGGAQIDRFGNLNSTVIGPYDKPKVRLPGSGGATEIATSCQRIYVVMRHNPRAFVDKLAFVTSLGHGVTGRERRAMGIETEGPVLLVTDLCTMAPAAESKEFEVVTPAPRRHARAGAGEYGVGRAICGRQSAKRALPMPASSKRCGISTRGRRERTASSRASSRVGGSRLAARCCQIAATSQLLASSEQPTASFRRFSF